MRKALGAGAVLIGLYLLATILSFFASSGDVEFSANVAVIPITGVISSFPEAGLFSSQEALSDAVIQDIEKAEKDPRIEGIIFEINSPGGTPVATDEIAQKIESLDKPTVAWIREIGTSGAYWIATSSDHIVANRMSVTGSIGVYGSYLQFDELLERFNVTYQRLVAGRYKDMGSQYRNLTSEEKDIYQDILDSLHLFFIEEVAENRNLSVEHVTQLATGQVYLGVDALELGLVDELGSKDEAVAYIEGMINQTAHLTEYKKEPGLLEILGSVVSDSIGKFKYLETSSPVITLMN